jgi:iron complex outermembrane receptor protein
MQTARYGNRSFRSLAWGCSALAIAAPAWAGAQEVAAPVVTTTSRTLNRDTDDNVRTGDIIVQARRRAESIQDVPASVGVLSEEALQARNILGVQDIKSAVANLATVPTSSAGGGYLAIRGQSGLSTPNIALDSQVGIYLDGVYLGRAQSSGGDLGGIARLEVYRGPQGTLFGRNSTAGAVNFITASPTGEFGVNAMAGIGNYDRRFGRVTFNSPDLGGISVLLSYQHEDFDGDLRNAAAGRVYTYAGGFGTVRTPERFGGRNSEALLGKIRYTGLDRVSLEYKFDYSVTDYVPTPIQGFGFISTAPGASGAGLFLLQPPGAVPLNMERKLLTLNQDGAGPAELTTEGHMLTGTIDLDEQLTIKNIAAYRRLSSVGALDLDAGVFTTPTATGARIPLGLLHARQDISQKQFSNELQLLGSYDAFDFILGGFYFHEQARQDQLQGSLPLLPGANGLVPVPASAVNQRDRTDNSSYAAYGHVDFRPIEALEIGLGARYTWDRKSTTDSRGAQPIIGRVRDEKLTYDASINYEIAPDINLYGRYAFGYVAGGFARNIAYRREETNSYEAGVKSQLFDRRLTLNASVFRTESTDLQRAIFVPGAGVAFFNIGELKVDGFEIEATARPFDGLTLIANYGYTDPKASDGSLPVTPPENLSLSAEYETPPLFSDATLSFRVDGDYRATYYSSNLNTEAQRNPAVLAPLPAAIWSSYGSQRAYNEALVSSLDAGDYWLFNGRVTLQNLSLAGSKARLSGYVRNIFNKRGKVFVIDYGVIAGGTFERERGYGLELTMDF